MTEECLLLPKDSLPQGAYLWEIRTLAARISTRMESSNHDWALGRLWPGASTTTFPIPRCRWLSSFVDSIPDHLPACWSVTYNPKINSWSTSPVILRYMQRWKHFWQKASIPAFLFWFVEDRYLNACSQWWWICCLKQPWSTELQHKPVLLGTTCLIRKTMSARLSALQDTH